MRIEYGFDLNQVDVPCFSVEAIEGIGKLFSLATLVLNVLETKDRVEIVFHGLNPDDPESKIEILAWELAEADEAGDWDDQEKAQQAARARLEPLFEGASPRQAFAAAQSMLPGDRRYEAIGSIHEPWAADLYLMPPDDCGDS